MLHAALQVATSVAQTHLRRTLHLQGQRGKGLPEDVVWKFMIQVRARLRPLAAFSVNRRALGTWSGGKDGAWRTSRAHVLVPAQGMLCSVLHVHV